MTYPQIRIMRFFLVFLASLFSVAAVLANGVQFVQADARTVRVGLPELDGNITLVAAGCFTEDLGAAEVIYRGPANGQVISLNRHSESRRDHLFDQFVLLDATGNPIGPARYATQIVTLEPQGQTAGWPKQIKGLQCVLDFDDAADLGAAHVTINVSLTSLLEAPVDSKSALSELTYDVDGIRYRFRAGQVSSLDRKFRAASSRGMNAIAILLCTGGNRRSSRHTLIHPDADLSAGNVFAVNLNSEEAERQYRAVIGFLGRRYSRPDKKYGSIGGYIVGNEVQSHWSWHNMGPRDAEDVIQQYADQLRLTYFALCNEVADPRVFVSFDHHWTSQQGKDSSRALPGRVFLDRMAEMVRENGDFPWHVAWHPYPESLFDPVFWEDAQATFSFETPKITFKNIEVLLGYLNRPELKHDNKRRRVILSEQGFHAGNTPASEEVQAAAFAASYIRISALKGIDAYILHRHVDHPREGGLKLGLWTERDGRRDRERPIYRVFQAAGTPSQTEAFRFALPIVALNSWEGMSPRDRVGGQQTSVQE